MISVCELLKEVSKTKHPNGFNMILDKKGKQKTTHTQNPQNHVIDP